MLSLEVLVPLLNDSVSLTRANSRLLMRHVWAVFYPW